MVSWRGGGGGGVHGIGPQSESERDKLLFCTLRREADRRSRRIASPERAAGRAATLTLRRHVDRLYRRQSRTPSIVGHLLPNKYYRHQAHLGRSCVSQFSSWMPNATDSRVQTHGNPLTATRAFQRTGHLGRSCASRKLLDAARRHRIKPPVEAESEG